MTSAPATAIAATATAPTPDSAVRCTRCRYDLRGTDAGGRCPECGLPAYWSLRAPEQLSQYPAKWVASVSWATRLLAMAYGGMCAMLFAGFANLLDGVSWVAPIGFLTAALLQFGAALLLARRSGHWSEPRGVVSRLVLLVGSIAAVAASGIGIYMAATRIPQPDLLVGALLATMCGWVVAPPAALYRIRTVARMIADARLARQSAIAFWGLLLSLLMTAIGIAVVMFFSFSPVEHPVAALASVVLMSVVLCFLLWAAVVMFFCVRDFGRAARVARQAETIAETS